MKYTVLDTQTDLIFEEIQRRIHRLQSGGTLDSIREVGANTDNQIGASYLSLKHLASQYAPNEKLALLLWQQKKREQQIFACFLLPECLNREKITQLFALCISFEVAGYFGSLYLAKRADLLDISQEWLTSDLPYLQLAVLTSLSRYFILHKQESTITTDFFKTAINRTYKDKYVQLAAERYRFNI